MTKRLFLACIAIAALCLVPVAARQSEPVPFAITHGPYLQLPSATSMTVVWHTNRPAVSKVEYWPVRGSGGRQAHDPVQTAVSAAYGLIDNDRTAHVIRLEGLQPGTTYQYRVTSREFQGYEKQHIVRYGPTVTSEPYSFTTLRPSAETYSFPVFSDIHENSKRLDGMLANIDWSVVPFVVFNGDMVNDFMNADQPFTGFVDVSTARFARAIPFVYIRGNHDVRGRFARRLTDYFPASGGANGRAYYSFDHGPVHFVVLDSGEDKVDSHEYYNGLVAFEPYRREQAAWLAEDLRTATARGARYRVVFSHIPPYQGTADSRSARQKDGAQTTAGVQTPREEGFATQQVREGWEKIANQGGVNLWLSGHTHRFAYVAPTPGRNRYHLVIGAPDSVTRVDVTRQQLTVTVTRETGEVVKAITLR